MLSKSKFSDKNLFKKITYFPPFRKNYQVATDDDTDISDSDDEDNFNINILEIDTDIQVISRIPEEERSTHFITIRISNPQIIRAAKSVQVRFHLKTRHFLKL